ncbi:MAG: YbaB/EbfC family nucleoid-associated protein [Oscillospiraceae bacterium]|jgi:DNA-binding YbaB/EbfC family protein|nr:YbaB/EbfC family nucleoid-associated protein [Oscillospiraceae bacterium]
MAKSAFRKSPRIGGGGSGGGGMPGNQSNMLRQAQKMQADMLAAQEDVEAAEYSATSGGGVVSAKVSGKKLLLDLTIDKEAIDPEDSEMLVDLIISAVNSASGQADAAMEEAMGKFSGGLGIPGF